MNSFVRRTAVLGLCFYGFCSAQASETTVHSLTVAANSALMLSNDDVDKIIEKMNSIIARAFYPWDTGCPTVLFKRSGNLINIGDYNFLTAGTFSQLRDALHKFAPSANVMVVSSINCDGVTSAKGCATVGEPLIVGQMNDGDDDSPGTNPHLWLHERGHNVGLDHSANSPTPESSVSPSVALRLMFWRLGSGHLGKTAGECAAFENAMFASVSKSFAASGHQNALSLSQLATENTSTTSQLSLPSVADTSVAATVDEARKLGLTEAAIKAVGAPWEGKAPYEDIKALNQLDINSIRTLFHNSPNRFWPQAIQVLAIADGAEDLTLVQNALNLPMPDVSPRDSRSAIKMNRIIREIKSVIPMALAIIANKTKSKDASNMLISIADINNAKNVIGSASAVSLSKSAIAGMFVADTVEVNKFLNVTVDAKIPVNEEPKNNNLMRGVDGRFKVESLEEKDGEKLSGSYQNNKDIKVAPISPEELEAMKKNHERIRALGLESILKGM